MLMLVLCIYVSVSAIPLCRNYRFNFVEHNHLLLDDVKDNLQKLIKLKFESSLKQKSVSEAQSDDDFSEVVQDAISHADSQWKDKMSSHSRIFYIACVLLRMVFVDNPHHCMKLGISKQDRELCNIDDSCDIVTQKHCTIKSDRMNTCRIILASMDSLLDYMTLSFLHKLNAKVNVSKVCDIGEIVHIQLMLIKEIWKEFSEIFQEMSKGGGFVQGVMRRIFNSGKKEEDMTHKIGHDLDEFIQAFSIKRLRSILLFSVLCLMSNCHVKIFVMGETPENIFQNIKELCKKAFNQFRKILDIGLPKLKDIFNSSLRNCDDAALQQAKDFMKFHKLDDDICLFVVVDIEKFFEHIKRVRDKNDKNCDKNLIEILESEFCNVLFHDMCVALSLQHSEGSIVELLDFPEDYLDPKHLELFHGISLSYNKYYELRSEIGLRNWSNFICSISEVTPIQASKGSVQEEEVKEDADSVGESYSEEVELKKISKHKAAAVLLNKST